MAWSGILLILLAGWLALAVGRKLLCCFGRLVPSTMLGVAAIIGCVTLFAGRWEPRVRFRLDHDGAKKVAYLVDESLVERDLSPAASLATIAATDIDQQRPAWVDAPAKLVNTVYSVPIKSGLFASLPECQRALDLEMKREADHYINEYLGDEGASELVGIPLDYLKKNVKKAEYGELIRSESVGPMHQVHALLEFDENARADFHHRQHDALVTDRLWYAGSGAALVLALLGTFYGYLKLDLRSGGAHPGRLRLAATLVALIVAAGALLVRWAVPF